MTRWAMVIDLSRCIGCKSCLQACSQANRIPHGLWRKFHELKGLPSTNRHRFFATRSCMHCEDPPCEKVCPTGATFKREDGIVDIDYGKCVGCGYCTVACPYDARVIFRYHHYFDEDIPLTEKTILQAQKNREGVCTKCNFCVSIIENGLNKNLKPGIDTDATPRCVATCSTGALVFGDLDDPESQVSRMIKECLVMNIFDEVKTGPSVYYVLSDVHDVQFDYLQEKKISNRTRGI